MAEERKDSFTFSDKIKSNKPAVASSGVKRTSARLGVDGKPKVTLYERTKRDAPFFIAALAALLLLPFLVKYTGTSGDDWEGGPIPTIDQDISADDGMRNAIGDDMHSGMSTIDLLTKKLMGEDSSFNEDLPSSYNEGSNFMAEDGSMEKIAKTVHKMAPAQARAAVARQPTSIAKMGASRTAGYGGGLKGNWSALKAEAAKTGTGAARVASKPVSLQPLIAGRSGRSVSGEAAMAEAKRALDALNKGPALQALMDAQLRPTGIDGMGNLKTGSLGGSRGGSNIKNAWDSKGMKPWWWDMYQKRQQMIWEWKFELFKSLATPLINCLVTGDSIDYKVDWARSGGTEAGKGGEEKCCGKKKDKWPDAWGEFSERNCTAIILDTTKKCPGGWEKAKSAGGISTNALETRLNCLGFKFGSTGAEVEEEECEIGTTVTAKDGTTTRAYTWPLTFITTAKSRGWMKAKWRVYHFVVVDRYLDLSELTAYVENVKTASAQGKNPFEVKPFGAQQKGVGNRTEYVSAPGYGTSRDIPNTIARPAEQTKLKDIAPNAPKRFVLCQETVNPGVVTNAGIGSLPNVDPKKNKAEYDKQNDARKNIASTAGGHENRTDTNDALHAKQNNESKYEDCVIYVAKVDTVRGVFPAADFKKKVKELLATNAELAPICGVDGVDGLAAEACFRKLNIKRLEAFGIIDPMGMGKGLARKDGKAAAAANKPENQVEDKYSPTPYKPDMTADPELAQLPDMPFTYKHFEQYYIYEKGNSAKNDSKSTDKRRKKVSHGKAICEVEAKGVETDAKVTNDKGEKQTTEVKSASNGQVVYCCNCCPDCNNTGKSKEIVATQECCVVSHSGSGDNEKFEYRTRMPNGKDWSGLVHSLRGSVDGSTDLANRCAVAQVSDIKEKCPATQAEQGTFSCDTLFGGNARGGSSSTGGKYTGDNIRIDGSECKDCYNFIQEQFDKEGPFTHHQFLDAILQEAGGTVKSDKKLVLNDRAVCNFTKDLVLQTKKHVDLFGGVGNGFGLMAAHMMSPASAREWLKDTAPTAYAKKLNYKGPPGTLIDAAGNYLPGAQYLKMAYNYKSDSLNFECMEKANDPLKTPIFEGTALFIKTGSGKSDAAEMDKRLLTGGCNRIPEDSRTVTWGHLERYLQFLCRCGTLAVPTGTNTQGFPASGTDANAVVPACNAVKK